MLELLGVVDADLDPVGTASSVEETLAKLQALVPDVVVLDMHLSGHAQTTLTEQIKTRRPGTRVIILSPSAHDSEICRELRDGAEAVVPKTVGAPELMHAILGPIRDQSGAETLRGQRPPSYELSAREIDVLRCLAHGMTNSDIAFALTISVSTVKAHVEHILRKLGASDRANAVAKAFRRGLIE